MCSIIYTEKSIYNLQEISLYILQDNSFQAKKVIDSIKYSISYLESFPFLWKEVKNWFRQIVEKEYKYRIIYKVEKEIVYIVSIFKYKDFL